MKQIDFLIETILILFENIVFANIKAVMAENTKDIYVETLEIKRLHKIMNGNVLDVIAWDSG